MPLFTVNAKGADGGVYGIYLDVDSVESCERIIEQLGLDVDPTAFGELLEVNSVTLSELISMCANTHPDALQ